MELENLAQKLPEEIKKVWRQTYFITIGIFSAVSIGLSILFYAIDISFWWSLIGYGVTVLYFVLTLFVIVPFRWARWSYQIRHDEIEIQHGIIFRSRVLIPMIRVQHVETEQGPLLRRQKLVRVSISTAATVHHIEAVRAQESDTLRHHILELVKVAKEDV
ncbi:PH domain-containing protein [Listeria booriae]|uniref:PH domain-containing protein n=1 Tax=Listeria booriae TaxID=1552123 RepID=UPI0016245A23|nr:PH domain-containing protein [Listeria booriae]MBC1975000.1 PH domain-containing protein [Listeria booriae]MBC2021031.1 PH domain-containing protein [Listeria booriae]MBC2032292.1 PH domain-containing protein [Listeria booriae]MBC2047460.1 PH domain-containing protein [Listeria booriae]